MAELSTRTGTLIPIDRVADDRAYYSGRHKRHGVNVQVLSDGRGPPVLVSADESGWRWGSGRLLLA